MIINEAFDFIIVAIARDQLINNVEANFSPCIFISVRAAAEPESRFSLVGLHGLDVFDTLFPHVSQCDKGIDRGSCLQVGNHENVNRPPHRTLTDFEEFGDVRVSFGDVFDVGCCFRVAMIIIKAYRNFLSGENKDCYGE